MSEIVPFGSGLAKSGSRRVGREIGRMNGQGQLELVRIGIQADLQAERVSAVAYVGKRAQHEVAMVSQLEGQLSALVPAAIPRLQGIGDLTALAMAEVVSETIRKVK